MKTIYALIMAGMLALCGAAQAAPAAAAADVRLYRLDCGTMHFSDLSMMSDSGEYQGQTYDIVISCYVIKHGDDYMLWDTGFAKNFQQGVKNGTLDMKLSTTIVDQLRTIGLSSDDIRYVAISHSHFDHTGQTKDFPKATLIMQQREYAVLSDKKAAEAHFIDPELLGIRPDHLKLIDGDYDFFGDGTVKTILLPGHTPGHMALQLTLPHAGPVILSGDQWHFTENRARNQVPTFNFDHDATLKSSARLEQILRSTGARLIIQHEPADNAKLPKLPAYLD
jgi:glyoxylase-like metal-dependent hydrolase (beta-lactamase superfamily II)